MNERVYDGCKNPIEIIFETLFLQRGEKPYTWYKTLGYDKSFASLVRRGLLIPKYEDRIKISKYFKVDSSAIWRVKDMDYIQLVSKNQAKKEDVDDTTSLNNVNKSGEKNG
jgi:hypothetical protein